MFSKKDTQKMRNFKKQINLYCLFRFKTNTRLCLSISDFHPDTWNPAWSVSTILTGLLSFMVSLHFFFQVAQFTHCIVFWSG